MTQQANAKIKTMLTKLLIPNKIEYKTKGIKWKKRTSLFWRPSKNEDSFVVNPDE